MGEIVREFNYKVVVLGDPAVGKTSLVRRHAKGKFDFDAKATIGVDVTTKHYKLERGLLLSLSLWDVAGQEFSDSMRHQYYQGATAGILVFDLTRPDSFWHAKVWYVDLRDNLQQRIPIVLIGNKNDLPDQRQVTTSEARELAEGYGFSYVETSAATGDNVDRAFYNLVAQIIMAKNLASDIFGIREI
jgi:Ras-related protein Rab-11A